MLVDPLAPGLSLLGGRSGDAALVLDSRAISYAELADRVADRRDRLGATRRLVMISAANALEPIVTYLAALEGGHPVMLVAGGGEGAGHRHRDSLVARFDPDVLAHDGARDWALEERRPGSRHEFHPDLAMLASTSGSTGSPKLVRLSHGNLSSNAAAIAEYLRLEPTDRAATTLPLQYCYGLSVVNSHLLTGASLLVTEHSVAEEVFWTEAAEHRITSFAGVPYTFELLEAVGFAERTPPSLRYLTQAGGRLAPERTRRFARLGRERGFDFFVMYGQTEATARMAYLPPRLAETAAGAIGVPVPGGRFRIDAGRADGADAPDGATGELVYQGPNVMLGYAGAPEDFALGRTVEELRTGDVARRRDDGLYEIVGRMSRFVKIFGLRLDLDRIEQLLAEEGLDVRAAHTEERLLLFASSERAAGTARTRAAELLGLPSRTIGAYAVAEFPRTANGKPDTAALVRLAQRHDLAGAAASTPSADRGGGAATSDDVRELLATLLSRPEVGLDDSFAGLGGDSLSYIEVSLRLEELLGPLPRDWPTRTIRDLTGQYSTERAPATERSVSPDPSAAPRPPQRSGTVGVETSAVLRAVGIVLIVGTHADLFAVKGAAHLLLAVVGFTLARFQLAPVPGAARVRRLLGSAAQIAVPTVLWIGAVAALTGQYRPTTALLVNNLVPGDGRWNEQWQFWFLEAVLGSIVGLAALLALRPVDRLERRAPFAVALTAVVLALALRFTVAGAHAEHVEKYAAPVVLWLVALGWLVARADTAPRRWLVSVITVAGTAGFFGDPLREAVVAVGVLMLLWCPSIRLPRWTVPVVAALAGASLFVYLTHWQVYPPFEQDAPWVGTILSLLIGVLAWRAYSAASRRLRPRPHRGT